MNRKSAEKKASVRQTKKEGHFNAELEFEKKEEFQKWKWLETARTGTHEGTWSTDNIPAQGFAQIPSAGRTYSQY